MSFIQFTHTKATKYRKKSIMLLSAVLLCGIMIFFCAVLFYRSDARAAETPKAGQTVPPPFWS